jgi:hypothetical protein
VYESADRERDIDSLILISEWARFLDSLPDAPDWRGLQEAHRERLPEDTWQLITAEVREARLARLSARIEA